MSLADGVRADDLRDRDQPAPARIPPRRFQESLAAPPAEAEAWAYLRRPQHRWLFSVTALCFAGVATSMVGFAMRSAWTVLFLIPLSLFVAEALLSLRTSTYRRRITASSHLRRVSGWKPEACPSVDVFLPCAGESLDMLANTYTHVSRLVWDGKLEVYVLDDSGRHEIRMLAESYGFTYVSRPSREFKKAGNLQYGLERSKGDFIFLLDADFVPRTDALLHLIPYTDDPRTGIVQSPQYFDTDRSMSWLERSAGATQELFYRMIQPSRDAVGAAICVGSSAIYRRSSLAAIGGFPQIGHSEDVYTGLALEQIGHRVTYVPINVTKGVCPDNVDQFIAQQYRWCEGSMSIVGDIGFHANSMAYAKRMCFWSGFLYYITTAVNAVIAPVAVIVMLWVYPDQIATTQMLPLVGSLAVWLVVFPLLMFGRWRPEVLRVQVLYGFAHLLSIAHVVRGSTLEWIPSRSATPEKRTGKGAAQSVSTLLIWHVAITQLAIFAGLTEGIIRFGIGPFWALVLVSLFTSHVYIPVGVAVARGRIVASRRREGRPSRP